MNSADSEEYAIAYFEAKTNVGACREGLMVDLDQRAWLRKLGDKRAQFERLGKKLTVTGLPEAVTATAVIPLNQTDTRFGVRNANLTGRSVDGASGTKTLRPEVKLNWKVEDNSGDD